MGGTFRTICVRPCDGYYFPIRYQPLAGSFSAGAACQARLPGGAGPALHLSQPRRGRAQAVSLDGQPYLALPAAFSHRKALDNVLRLSPAGRELGGSPQGARQRRRWRRRRGRDPGERKEAVAAAAAPRPKPTATDPQRCLARARRAAAGGQRECAASGRPALPARQR